MMELEKLQARDDLKLTKSKKEAALFGPDGEKVHVLNRTALFIWERLDGRHTLQDMIQEMEDSFQIEEDSDLSKDILNTAHKFQQLGLLKPV
ncbi:PqqD family protein [candidate division CSSED10-310 bacterium]|uniref:PqqD family protein n=1 Tax=candidate division CSSED10-310 bacterium TaxID=2855610 RepID=A0ABV6YTQ0_UNCC1